MNLMKIALLRRTFPNLEAMQLFQGVSNMWPTLSTFIPAKSNMEKHILPQSLTLKLIKDFFLGSQKLRGWKNILVTFIVK